MSAAVEHLDDVIENLKDDIQEQEQSKTKRQPPYSVVVYNDDQHTYVYVMRTFAKVFGYATPKCYKLAHTIHTKGLAHVWSGSMEVAELKRDQVRGAGPDIYADKNISFPLRCEIEPLPG